MQWIDQLGRLDTTGRMTDLLDNDLCTEIESSKTHATEDCANHEAGSRDIRLVGETPEDRCASHQAHNLPINQPEAGAYRADSLHQPRCDPRSQNLNHYGQRPGYAYLGRVVTG